jgi:octaheme c-type cytochrome (tetrathionate reductase family)
MTTHIPCRVRRPFLSPGTFVLLAIAGTGFAFGIARYLTGIGSVTNLNDRFPWGIWVAIDVACGVALAAGGFTTAALIDIFGGHRFKPLLRPAVLTAWLGYAMVGFALLFDLGRYWNAWQPLIHWQGNSVLFEVGMCVMFYLVVLTVEMSPSILEGLEKRVIEGDRWARVLFRFWTPIRGLHRAVHVALPLFIIAGVVLSCMHQSSLGTLMVIAPTKLHPFWYTPWLPVLFLLSAIMVGFPMVILESMIASRAFDREPEMDLLAPLARYIPWFIGVYAVARLTILFANWSKLDAASHPGSTVALMVELLIGLAVPFAMLLFEPIRRSPGWLLFAALLVVFGVALNRINVFVVGFHPPFEGTPYVPSIGEIAVTSAIISTLVLLYRAFVIAFPIITGPDCPTHPIVEHDEEPVSPVWAWAFRGATVACLGVFVVLYAVVHHQSIERSRTELLRLERVLPSATVVATVPAVTHELRPRGYRTAYMLDHPALNETDDYEPVRFSHRSHDAFTGGDCAACHHRVGFDDDRVGTDLAELHSMMDIRLGPACSSCHGNLDENSPQACSGCHQHAGEDDAPGRPGLQGAMHRQCMGCHETSRTDAPLGCGDCHHPNVPDHETLATFSRPVADPRDVTRRCLDCHAASAADVLTSVHWQWGGHSPNIAGYEHSVELGLETVFNNHLICALPGDPMCAACHVGYGRADSGFDATDPENIDCLVCHAGDDTYSKTGTAQLDLASVAAEIGRPDRAACGRCHFYSDGGANVKHGDLEPALAEPSAELDVHMGRYDLRCQDCHTTSRHRIAGRSHSAPASEGKVECTDCHGDRPHRISGLLGTHLDEHVSSLACESCHIPHIAQDVATRVFLDWSQAGRTDVVEPPLEHGRPTYDPKLGAMRWERNLVPVYAWHDGSRDAYVLGETINPRRATVLNAPTADRASPDARIAPFKLHRAMQPYDTASRVLAVPKLSDGYWEHFDWARALADGMAAVGLEFSGEYDFTETVMYTSIHHQVAPKRLSLGCADCHAAEAVACSRCHPTGADVDAGPTARRVYPDEPRRLDFEALGYDEDPARTGGRFTQPIGRGRPPV